MVEEMAIVEAKKSDPASADEVFENIFVGNKAQQRTRNSCLGKESLMFLTWHQTPR